MERLKISIGKTYNLGNYESLRLDVGLEVEELLVAPSTYDLTYSGVKEMLSKMETDQGVSKRR